jgi:hypothetical protein
MQHGALDAHDAAHDAHDAARAVAPRCAPTCPQFFFMASVDALRTTAIAPDRSGGVGPVPVQMWQREPGLGADVGGVSRSPSADVATVQRWKG